MKLPFCSSFLLLVCVSLQLEGSSGVAQVSRTITVAQSGQRDFSSVQAAVDSVPENNNQWIRIYVKAGTYTEKVTIPKTKPYVLLEGESGNSVIQYNDRVAYFPGDLGPVESATENSATFAVWADNFVARSITFKNTYYGNDAGAKGNVSQAVAVLIGGDKSALYNCDIVGYQDTLCDRQGRHLFHECNITGAVDFIFGFAQSMYEKCKLISLPTASGPGWLTAHNRENPDQKTGFIFKYATVTGHGQTYLGRPWGPFARVLFFKSTLSSNVVPSGWATWGGSGETATFAEEGCVGPGANKSQRVPWMKTIAGKELRSLISRKQFINGDQWVDQQP